MLIVSSSQHLAKFRPGRQRGQSDMSRDESFAVIMNKLQQIRFLLLIQLNLAVSHEKDGVRHCEARTTARRLPGGHHWMIGNDIGVCPDKCVPKTRFITEPFDDRQGVRSRVVLRDAIASVGPRQYDLACPRRSAAAAAALTTSLRVRNLRRGRWDGPRDDQ